MRGTQILTVLVALGLVVGAVPGGALASASTGGDATDIGTDGAAPTGIDASTVSAQTDGNTTNGNASGSDDGNATDGASRATVGQQLATIIAVTDDEVSGDVDASSFDAALEDANESERAAILAERSAALRERADGVVADQREARVAYEDAEIDRGEFAQRLAVLSGQARTVDRGFERVADGADDVSGIELRAAGYNQSANADARERLTRVTGTGASALLAQYTGESAGEFSLEVDGGVSIEVESDDGERSREIEREQPGDGTFEVNQSEALTAATEQLSTDADGEWTLRSTDRDEDDGYYEFEFTFFGPETTGEADVSVDGQTGEVFEFEEETEPRERDDGDDAADETPLSISIANGTAEPNATVTLRVTAAAEPVEGATVELGDRAAGTTDADGRIEVTLPDDDEVDIEVADGEREGELELTLGADDDRDDRDDDFAERFSVSGSVENGTVDVSVTYDSEAVEDVSVSVDGDRVGTTGANGTLSFDAPTEDEFDVTLVKGDFEAEIEFEVGSDGTIATGDIDVDDESGDEADVDDESGDDADDENLSIAVVSGDPAPGATATVEVTDAAGEPVEGATVEVGGEAAGTTDADGRIDVTLPDDDEVGIEVEDGDREGELEFEFAADDDDAEDESDESEGDNAETEDESDDEAEDDTDDDDDEEGDDDDDEEDDE
ncbi:hypothetical protein EKH57_10205 [Halorubrum sp. BOL3-1]|uniref:DUF7096 domain-containing protein n=1 Tax=Halorubrum sp. BOL3-1 TaxID=2497325 RepID=UPI001004E8F4|nr:hypothetical protein [Halorubrum sp. BOL3-1]QAU13062.1 hypothetical protein EKH57_10205 [Halorubrum sp. BOL3-1]